MIKFKKKRLEFEFDTICIKNTDISDLMYYIERFCWNNFDKDIVITSVKRDYRNSVHFWWRGIDFRSRGFKDWQITVLLLMVNSKFPYDKNRPKKKTLIHHKVKTGALHFHLQTL